MKRQHDKWKRASRVAVCGGTRRVSAAIALAALLALAGSAWGQRLALDARPTQSSYVVGEPILVRIKVDNYGSQPVVIGDHPVFRNNRLFFEINQDPLVTLAPLREGRIVEEIDLERDESFSDTLDLGAWYPLLQEGRYYFNLVLLHNDLRYASERRMFDVVPGIALASTTAPLGGRPPSEREFKLVYWPRGDRELLFLRAMDRPSGQVWSTLELGPVVRIAQPRLLVNNDNSLTVTYQATRDVLVTSQVQSDMRGPRLLEQKQRPDTSVAPLVQAITEAAAAAAQQDAKQENGRKREKGSRK